MSITPGRTKHLQTHFMTDEIELCDCPGLVLPTTAPKPLQVLAGNFPHSQLREPYSTVQYLAERIDIISPLRLVPPESADVGDSKHAALAYVVPTPLFGTGDAIAHTHTHTHTHTHAHIHTHTHTHTPPPPPPPPPPPLSTPLPTSPLPTSTCQIQPHTTLGTSGRRFPSASRGPSSVGTSLRVAVVQTLTALGSRLSRCARRCLSLGCVLAVSLVCRCLSPGCVLAVSLVCRCLSPGCALAMSLACRRLSLGLLRSSVARTATCRLSYRWDGYNNRVRTVTCRSVGWGAGGVASIISSVSHDHLPSTIPSPPSTTCRSASTTTPTHVMTAALSISTARLLTRRPRALHQPIAPLHYFPLAHGTNTTHRSEWSRASFHFGFSQHPSSASKRCVHREVSRSQQPPRVAQR
jgi:hypothetical protein